MYNSVPLDYTEEMRYGLTFLLTCKSWIKCPSEGSAVEIVVQNANTRKRREGVHMVAILLYLRSPCSIYIDILT